MKAIGLIVIAMLWTTLASAMSFWGALAEIESGQNDYVIGSVGEVSRYQIRPEIWKAYAPGHHYDYTDRGFALSIAEKYLKRLKSEFAEATGRQATEEDCVIMWKAGFSGYEKRGFNPVRMSAAHQDRITRFRNLRTEDATLVRLTAPKSAAAPASSAAEATPNTKPAEASPPQPLFTLPTMPEHDLILGIEKPPGALPTADLFTMTKTTPAMLPGVTPSIR
jgi:hypothetical protein